jgi:thioredoxin-related protein
MISTKLFKNIFTILILIISGTAVAYVFWTQEIKYTLPTEKPLKYQEVEFNSIVDLNSKITNFKSSKKFFHFFNPDCPCSRFNLKHFMSLYKSYKNHISFYVVIPQKKYDAEFKSMISDEIPIIIDSNDSLAKQFGVYSTPQAVILTANNSLFFRGNYNKARYCTNKESLYAKMALDSLINNKPSPVLPVFATKAYGCSIYN